MSIREKINEYAKQNNIPLEIIWEQENVLSWMGSKVLTEIKDDEALYEEYENNSMRVHASISETNTIAERLPDISKEFEFCYWYGDGEFLFYPTPELRTKIDLAGGIENYIKIGE